ncbi:MAG: alpha/beta hydrolase [Candidatus Marinimicrobia bacterium]|nr:alpha/beta hydrolase [Candidatus Neomarinimicrobiota bacterium]
MMNALPPPGELIYVNGRKVHIQRYGKGSPVVIFDSGFFNDSFTFGYVQPQIANLTCTISYDRAGMGYSEPSPTPERNSKVLASELYELIETLGLRDPIVFAGWSAGGIYIREFARQHPDRVAGMILIDSASECQKSRYPEDITFVYQKNWDELIGLISRLSNKTHEEIIRELIDSPPWVNNHPETHKYHKDLARPELLKYYLKLDSFLDEDTNQNINVMDTLGDFPLAVIYRSKINNPNMNEYQRKIAMEIYHEIQSELAQFSTYNWHIKADCGHDIANEKPEVVIEAIKDVVKQVRRSN